MTTAPSARIPPAVCQVLGEASDLYHYIHAAIDALFALYGAPDEAPEGGCVRKSITWLKRASDDPQTNALEILGGVLREFMESNRPSLGYQTSDDGLCRPADGEAPRGR